MSRAQEFAVVAVVTKTESVLLSILKARVLKNNSVSKTIRFTGLKLPQWSSFGSALYLSNLPLWAIT